MLLKLISKLSIVYRIIYLSVFDFSSSYDNTSFRTLHEMAIIFINNLSSLGSSVGDEVNNSVGVAEFVIIPADQFDKVVIQLDACIGIKD